MISSTRLVGSVLLTLGLQSCISNHTTAKNFALEIDEVYTVQPNIIALRLKTGETITEQQIPYDPQPGDKIKHKKNNRWLRRQGKVIGAIVGKNEDILAPLERYVGEPLDVEWTQAPENYKISSNRDSNYRRPVTPQAIFRKTKPTNMAQLSLWEFAWPLSHTLYLELPTPLEPGKTYEIDFEGDDIEDVDFQYQPDSIRSEAVHISHLGFRPDDPAKVGFLSAWMGNGRDAKYTEGLTFWLINEENDQKVFTGQTQLSKAKTQPEDPHDRNYNGANIYWMDFSEFKRRGTYRLCVEGIGCSFSFPIEDQVWQDAFRISTRGFYHQRSGIALKPPYTTFQRPRPFHPEDGVKVYQSTTPLMDTGNGLNAQGNDPNNFTNLIQGKTDQEVPNAWGGYFDAGDWDRRIQHLEIARLLLELSILFPNYFQQIDLNIPESNNSLPDVVDEALWGIDFFQRLQTPEGGIRGGIESTAHPKYGEGSWQESLEILAYAPGIWSSHIYAGVAARAAYLLEQQSPQLAQKYRTSALQAMKFAEQEYLQSQSEKFPHQVQDQRNLAALELFRLTGDEQWHQLFLETTVFDNPENDTYVWNRHDQRDAAFLYARLQNPKVDRQIQRNAKNALIREADRSLNIVQNTGFKWTKILPKAPVGWGNSFGSPKVLPLLRAHVLTNELQYLQGAVLGTQFAAGANPDNMVYTTGLGHKSPQNPLILDQRVTGQNPPPGITVYGPLDMIKFKDYWTIKLLAQETFPHPAKWPTTEGYFDIYKFPAVTEFTIMQTMAPTAYTWGYLAARKSLD